MKKYYVIFMTKNGDTIPAYVINDKDNDLDHHLKCEGDMFISYEIYDTKKDALNRAAWVNSL